MQTIPLARAQLYGLISKGQVTYLPTFGKKLTGQSAGRVFLFVYDC